ncbi:MAG: hypothetical protein NZ922_06785 [Candidatus Methanomethyliaceae archaeon]|nr:hypothetical protein [Candidatus Methanomethyliaceae archaeon]MDW7971138.1 helix-turn-helix domain-containing protein [Nitrososphaerota archaeon]
MELQDLAYILTKLGLSEYESKVYISLINQGICGVKELAVSSKVPRTKIYSTLKSLERKKLVTILPGKPVKAKALMPTRVFVEPLKELEENLQLLKNALSELQRRYEISSSKEGLEEQSFWIIKGNEDTIKRINELLNTASKEVYFIFNQEALEIIINRLGNVLNSLTKQRVSIKIMTNASYIPALFERLSDFIEVKYMPFQLDGGIMMVDDSEILVFKYSILDRKTRVLTAEHFTRSHMISSLKNLIVQLYKHAVDLSSLTPFLSIPNIRASFVDARQNIFLPSFFYMLMEMLSTRMGRDAFGFLTELGRKIIGLFYQFTVFPNFQDSLNLLSSFYLIDEGIEARFTWDENSEVLICELIGSFPEYYRTAHEHGLPIPPSIWGIYLLGLISLFGFIPSCEESTFDSNRWLLRYRLMNKMKTKERITVNNSLNITD